MISDLYPPVKLPTVNPTVKTTSPTSFAPAHVLPTNVVIDVQTTAIVPVPRIRVFAVLLRTFRPTIVKLTDPVDWPLVGVIDESCKSNL